MPGDYLLVIHVMPDSGLTDSAPEGAEDEPDPTTFRPVSNAESKLGLYLYYNDLKRMDEHGQLVQTPWSGGIWSPRKQLIHDHSAPHPHVNGVRTYGYVANLAQLDSPEAIRKYVKEFKENVKLKLGLKV
jgi:hypothetical protein